MKVKLTLAALCSALMVFVPLTLAAAGKLPSPIDVLFESHPLKTLDKGTKLVYSFERKVSNEKTLGLAYTDQITVDIANAHDNGKRDVAVQVFTGERARDVQEISGITNNPVLVIYLDRAVRGYKQIAGGRTPYLKNMFRVALRQSTKIEAVKIDYDGKKVDAYRITLKPYENDTNRSKMQGYERSSFEMVASANVPGHLVELKSVYVSSLKTAPKMEEHIKFLKTGE